MKQLSGLISKEGAAHIVANELGIKLFDSFTGKLQIKNIIAGLRNVETVGKVLQVYELREFTTNERQGIIRAAGYVTPKVSPDRLGGKWHNSSFGS